MIKVNIKVKEVVYYNQEIEMTKKDYEALRGVDGTDVPEECLEFDLIDSYIDKHDVYDNDNDNDNDNEWLSFEIDKI